MDDTKMVIQASQAGLRQEWDAFQRRLGEELRRWEAEWDALQRRWEDLFRPYVQRWRELYELFVKVEAFASDLVAAKQHGDAAAARRLAQTYFRREALFHPLRWHARVCGSGLSLADLFDERCGDRRAEDAWCDLVWAALCLVLTPHQELNYPELRRKVRHEIEGDLLDGRTADALGEAQLAEEVEALEGQVHWESVEARVALAQFLAVLSPQDIDALLGRDTSPAGRKRKERALKKIREKVLSQIA